MKKIFLGCLLLIIPAFVHAQTPSTPQMYFIPDTVAVSKGDTITVTVQADTGTQLIDSAGVYLNFDPAMVQITNVTAGSRLTTVLQNQHNNTAGTLDFAAGLLGSTTSGTFDLISIEFTTVQSGNTAVTFSTTGPIRVSAFAYQGSYLATDLNQLDISIAANPPAIPGDTDGDGDVDIFDYNAVITDFGKTGELGFSVADFDGDGDVDIFDYNVVISNFGR